MRTPHNYSYFPIKHYKYIISEQLFSTVKTHPSI